MNGTYFTRAKKWVDSDDVDIELIEKTIARFEREIKEESQLPVSDHLKIQDLKKTICFLRDELSGGGSIEVTTSPSPLSNNLSALATEVVPIKKLLGAEKKAAFQQIRNKLLFNNGE